jgi:2-iminobutanoate/2-iminopropanoate deaminase
MKSDKIVSFGNYQPIRQAGDMYFVSGQVGVDPATKLAPKDINGQVKQAMINLQSVLKTEYLGLKDITKTTLYLVNIDDFMLVDEIYSQFFNELKPARSTVAVRELPKIGGQNEILFEIEAIAYKKRGY